MLAAACSWRLDPADRFGASQIRYAAEPKTRDTVQVRALSAHVWANSPLIDFGPARPAAVDCYAAGLRSARAARRVVRWHEHISRDRRPADYWSVVLAAWHESKCARSVASLVASASSPGCAPTCTIAVPRCSGRRAGAFEVAFGGATQRRTMLIFLRGLRWRLLG